MLTKAQIKHIRSLVDKKYRYAHREFVVEGVKMVSELCKSNFEIIHIWANSSWQPSSELSFKVPVTIVRDDQLVSMSQFTSPPCVIALVKMPTMKIQPTLNKAILLDHIQDPGNLGSIIRTADWFGINHIVCSTDTVDVYNSKVIQSTMGSIFRVQVYYENLLEFLSKNKQIPLWTAVLNGEDITTLRKPNHYFLLMGNESRGIDERLLKHASQLVAIRGKGHAESLNVSVATAILCHEMNR
jgi:rRNA methylases